MSKKQGNPFLVNPNIARAAVKTGKDRKSLYSECVILSFKSTGRLAPGFDNRDLQVWLDLNCSGFYDDKGKYIINTYL